jgi:hypothetical protein
MLSRRKMRRTNTVGAIYVNVVNNIDTSYQSQKKKILSASTAPYNPLLPTATATALSLPVQTLSKTIFPSANLALIALPLSQKLFYRFSLYQTQN